MCEQSHTHTSWLHLFTAKNLRTKIDFSTFGMDPQELNVFQESLQTLKIAKTKFDGSKDALEQISDDWNNKEILVPLTGSMYVKGVINKIDKFIIDIGTGYYVEKVKNVETFALNWSITMSLIRFVNKHNCRTSPHRRTISSEKSTMCKSKWIKSIHWADKNQKYWMPSLMSLKWK